jgi:hypothetical protein
MHIHTSVLLLILLSSSCRFISPGSSETAELESRGTFSGGVPAWVKLPKEKTSVLPGRSGIINRTHTVPQGMSMSSGANASSAMASDVGRGFTREESDVASENTEALRKRTEVKDSIEETDSQSNVILRIESECPGMEKAVVAALKTESVQDRIRKNLALTRQCPSSADIWLWLARDYQSVRRYADSRRCIQAALAIDPENKEANELYESLMKGQGSTSN